MNELNMKEKGFFDYAEGVKLAKIDLKAKALLWFYAYTYNWSEGKPSYYTQEQICAYVGFSPSTFQKAKNRLIELGWIKTYKTSYDLPVFVSVKKGRDDENYEKSSWAKGHKSNKQTLEEAIASLPSEFRDPFQE
jgi:predicted transcriptional regulator